MFTYLREVSICVCSVHESCDRGVNVVVFLLKNHMKTVFSQCQTAIIPQNNKNDITHAKYKQRIELGYTDIVKCQSFIHLLSVLAPILAFFR